MADLTEWFHELASKGRGSLVREASAADREKLRLHITTSFSGYSPATDLNSEQFADYVLEMRANERAWNQATMAALIDADDLFKQGLTIDAQSALRDFAATCPWNAFREAALNQAANYR